jgi:hypothetical protein
VNPLPTEVWQSIDPALVRFLRPDHETKKGIAVEPVGMGILVDPQHIVTCAHVVNAALNRNNDPADSPDSKGVQLDFPLVAPCPIVDGGYVLASDALTAQVIEWDRTVDVAVLQLDTEAPADSRPVAFDDRRGRLSHPICRS